METIKLSNNVQVPSLGIGTFMISPEDTEKSVYSAIKYGYRMIDTANAYLNEEAVGKGLLRAIDEGIVTREEMFISTKLWPTVYEYEGAVDDTLARLGLDYVDLLFIHQPAGNFVSGYQLLEKAYEQKKARSLGISNFYGEKLERLLEASTVKPHVVQLEVHPYCTQSEYMERVKPYGTRLMGWYPLGHGDKDLVNEDIFTKLGEKYHKSNAQIILRWHTQMGFITIPGSKNPDHIRDNGDIFDFTLTEEELNEIAKLDGKKKYYVADNATEENYATMKLGFKGE